jgi:hypothetical protein
MIDAQTSARVVKLDEDGVYLNRAKVQDLFVSLTQALLLTDRASELADTVLRALVAERSPFSAEEARPLFSPLVRYLQLTRRAEVLEPVLRQVLESQPELRVDILDSGKKARPRLLTQSTSFRQEQTSPVKSDADIAELWLSSRQGDDAWRGSEAERLMLMRTWIQMRPNTTPSERAATDVRLLSFAVNNGHRIESDYAEALWADRTVWDTNEMALWAQSLLQPLNRARVGIAASALLNSRISEIVPLLFLNNPEAVVLTTVGRAAEIEDLQRMHATQLGARVLAGLNYLAELLGRKGTIKKDELRQVYDNVRDSLVLLGLRPVHEVGDITAHDSAEQETIDSVPHGQRVRVLRPGLRSAATGELVLKTRVEPLEAAAAGYCEV